MNGLRKASPTASFCKPFVPAQLVTVVSHLLNAEMPRG
jgi:hypothetical protein